MRLQDYSKDEIKGFQRQLNAHGFNPGPIDGIAGRLSRKALIAFKRSRGLRARDFIGNITKRALAATPTVRADMPAATSANEPPWLTLAKTYIGTREFPGSRHNRRIVGWWELLKLPFRDDETPWCAGFLNAMVKLSGFAIPAKYRAAALGWRWTGHGTRLPGPALGAIMDMTRPGRPGSGHMTLVAGRDAKGRVMGAGGNQGNMVQINPYSPTARDARYYWPPGCPLPAETGMHTLPLIDGGGRVLTNET